MPSEIHAQEFSFYDIVADTICKLAKKKAVIV